MVLTKKSRLHLNPTPFLFSLLLLIFTAVCTTISPLHANEKLTDKEMASIKSIDADYAEHFGSVLLQGRDGRIQPIDTAALALMKKVTGERSIFGLSYNQVFVGLISEPELWQKLPMIRVKHPKLKELLGILESDEYFTFNDIYDGQRYKLDTPARIARSKTKSAQDAFDTELLSIEEALGLLYNAYSGESLNIFPIKGDPSNAWTTPSKAMKMFSRGEWEIVIELLENNYYGVKDGVKNGDWMRANDAVEAIKAYQQKNGAAIIPPKSKVNTELLYNKYNIFERLIGIYLVLGMVLFAIVFASLVNPSLNMTEVLKKPLALLWLAFAAQTAALGMRWYISGHAPWSNSYETMIYISWAVMLAGIVFANRSKVTAISAAVFASVILYAASLDWFSPQITQLPPILKSFWFTLHVSVITASYGFFGLCALLGGFILIFLMILLMVILD